jgi:hypothetical protein
MGQLEFTMPTLSTILHEKRDDILTTMSLYNFKTDNVQILCHFHPDTLWGTFEADDFPHTLYFIAEGVQHADMYNEEDTQHFADRYSLEVRLSEILNCDIGVTFLKDIQGIAWENFREYCAKISEDKKSEDKKIAELFNAPSLDKIEVKELDRNDKHFQRRQEIATRKPEIAQGKKLPTESTTSSPHGIFKRKRLDSNEYGYSSSSTTDNYSDREEFVINRVIQRLKDSPVSTLDKVLEELQKLKQMKAISSDEKLDLNPKQQHPNKI